MNSLSIEQLWQGLWATLLAAEDIRLRFELGGSFENDVQQVPRFLQAHTRASTVADALFNGACLAIVAWNGRLPSPEGLDDGVLDGFLALQSTGFSAPQVSEWRAILYPDPEDEAYEWQLRRYDVGQDKVARDTLLWHAIASEMPVYPSAPIVTFLLDPTTSVMLHVYDDRGMDVIADDPAKLHDLHVEFADWLLDYDRERMTNLFWLRPLVAPCGLSAAGLQLPPCGRSRIP